MGNRTAKTARQAARDALAAAQEARAQRERADRDDLTKFYSAHSRLGEIDDWLEERRAALAAEAEERRHSQRLRCGTALRAIRDRGASLTGVAEMSGLTQREARDLIRLAEQTAEPDGEHAAESPEPNEQERKSPEPAPSEETPVTGGELTRNTGPAAETIDDTREAVRI
jgi:hypothetical protein